MTMPVVSLTQLEYRKQYLKTLQVFSTKCNHLEVESTWMKNRLGDILLRTISTDKTIQILSVGCGDGTKDSGLLEALRCRRVKYTALDSSPEMVQKFQDRVISSSRFPDADFRLLTISCEEFVERETKETYDLIHFIHVAYFINPVDQIISKYMSLLSPGGLLVILCGARDSPLEKVRTQTLEVEPMSPDISASLRQLGYEYWKETVSSHVDISCLRSTESREAGTTDTDEADLLLDFLAYVGDFRHNFPPSIISKFRDSLRAAAVQKGDKLLLEMPCDAFFIKSRGLQ